MSTSRSSTSSPRPRKRATKVTRPASSSNSRKDGLAREQHWATDSDDEGVETEDFALPQRPVPLKKKRAAKSSSFPRRFCKFSAILFPYLSPFIPYIILFSLLYLGIALARSWLYTYLSSLGLPPFLLAPLAQLSKVHLPVPHLRPLLSVPCATLGVLCAPGQGRRAKFELLSAGAARTASIRAQHAVSVFDHLIKLADPEESVGLALHPVECWELATAVRYTSSLDDREYISSQLSELGDLSREVKENVIGLNAQGQNAMVWIVHEFTRLEELLTRAASSGSSLNTKEQSTFTALLDSLFERINSSLSELLVSLDRALPSATRASDSARRIFTTIRASERTTKDDWDRLDWPVKLFDAVGGGVKANHLRRDLELTRASAGAVMGVWEALEGTRESLISYNAHVGHFKAGVVGFHLSGHGLSVSDEVISLKTVMEEMRGVVDAAKARSSRGKSRRVAELGD
ncbi:hypothetical protein JCM8547_003762 [Rhodosporidiobolus lusitaniae]